uniref:Uncharacterized protein n=1 Tax=Anguilla anguilla TaxID=7936 RepID=A0A0E9XN31_ANGAN
MSGPPCKRDFDLNGFFPGKLKVKLKNKFEKIYSTVM